MNNPIISFDLMKLTKDVVNGQPSNTLIQNIVNLVKNNFPGTTHLAISVPLNSDADFVSHGNKPIPLTPEAFTDFLLDTIHAAGYNALIRATDCYGEGIYNFPFQPNTAQHWITEATNHLTTHKAHLKNGDIAAYFPEFEGQSNGFGANVTDSWSNFYQGLITAVNEWSATNGITITSFTTINESEAISGWYPEANVAVNNGFIVDYYPDANITGETQWIANLKGMIDTLHNKYGANSYPVFIQETADTRNPNTGTTQQANPQMLADAFTQVIWPYLKSGELNGINFWNLFDTPQEGILSIDGSSVSLNPKGQALAKAFQSVATATSAPVPTPTPSPTLEPTPTGPTLPDAFTYTGNITIKNVTVSSDGKGNIDFSF